MAAQVDPHDLIALGKAACEGREKAAVKPDRMKKREPGPCPSVTV